MKNFLISILFLGVAGYVSMHLYESWRAGDWLKEGADAAEGIIGSVEELSYPARIEIENIDGATIAITLLARNASHIQFKRSIDEKPFVYPIVQLVSGSKGLVEKYPNTGLMNAGDHIGDFGIELGDAHVEQLRVGIRRIDEKIHRLKLDFSKNEGKTARRTIYRKIQGLERDRVNLEIEIAERK